jgi:hypothetical protein
MASPQRFVEDTRTLANDLGDLFDRMEALLRKNESLGGNGEGGWLQELSGAGSIAGTLPEGLTKEEFMNLLYTYTSLQTLLSQGHRTNLNRWRW